MRDPRVSQPFRSPLVTHLGFERGFHRLNKIAAYGLGQGFSRPTAASPSGVKPASRSDAARRADALDSLGERPRCIRRSLVGLSQSTAQRGSDDHPNCALCDGRVNFGPLRLPKPIRSRRSQLAGSTAARGGSDLPLSKPSKGATLCPTTRNLGNVGGNPSVPG